MVQIQHSVLSTYENNIIITDHASDGNSKGRLIDLGLARKLDSVPSGASHRAGTMQFMAIEVFYGKGHTYRHDFESCFYAFMYVCVRYGYEGFSKKQEKLEEPAQLNASKANTRRMRPTKTRILQGWYPGTFRSRSLYNWALAGIMVVMVPDIV
jgi:hypothetical protein